jgi:hypothetical protein
MAYAHTGFCSVIANGDVKVEHSEIDHLEPGHCVLKDGKRLPADLVLYANGYYDAKWPIHAVMGKAVADKCDEWVDYHNQFVIDPEGGRSRAAYLMEVHFRYRGNADVLETHRTTRSLCAVSSSTSLVANISTGLTMCSSVTPATMARSWL